MTTPAEEVAVVQASPPGFTRDELIFQFLQVEQESSSIHKPVPLVPLM